MSKRSAIFAFLLAINCSIFNLAHAVRHDGGAYFGANAGIVNTTVSFLIYSSEIDGASLNLNAGYLWSQYFATELGITEHYIEGGMLHGVNLGLKGILPFTIKNQDFSVFAKIGPSLMADNHGFANGSAFYGIGLSYSVTPKVDLLLQSQSYDAGFIRFTSYSFGFQWYLD